MSGVSRVWQSLWRGAARLDVAAIILGVLIALLAVGSALPQPGGAAATGFFGAAWLLIPWALLLVATLLCTLRRWRRIVSGGLPSPPDPLSQRAGGSVTTPPPLGEGLGVRGSTSTRPVPGGLHSRRDRLGLARLATLVTHLAVFLLLGGVLLNAWLGWRTELTLPPGATVEVERAGGLRVAADAFAVERYPDGSVADYVVALRVADSPATLRLNAPVVQNGVALTLRGYRLQPEGAAVTLQAAYDPGYPLMVLGGFLLFGGMTVTFTLAGQRHEA